MHGHGTTPVHRCAFPSGPEEAAELAAQVCRSALAAGSPVLVYLDPDVCDGVASRVPRAGGAVIRPQQDLLGAAADQLVGSWLSAHGPGPVTVLCQRPFDLLPDIERWRDAEPAANAAGAGRPITLTCLFDETRTPAASRHMARATHPALLLDGSTLPNPDYRPPAATGGDGADARRVLADAVLDPAATAVNRAWCHERLREADVEGNRRDELVLVVHEAVTTVGAHDGAERCVPVRLWATEGAVGCDVLTQRPYEPLEPHRWPTDQHLVMLWLAEKVSPTVTVEIRPHGAGSRIRVCSSPPDGHDGPPVH
jgi:hypothetical protein